MYKSKRVNNKYSAEFKLCVIMDKVKNNLGVKETVRKYGLKSHQTLKQWEHIYIHEGVDGFMTECRGKKSRGRPRRSPLGITANDDIITENKKLKEQLEYVQAELAYLKNSTP